MAQFFFNMSKHKNQTQNEIFLQFMENNPDIARGYVKREKPLVDSLWQQLAEDLNSAGPPNKDASSWKKVWTDWKSEVKKKLAQNKAEECATGGGPFSKHTLSQTEEAIVRICGISRSVEGVSGEAMGIQEDAIVNCPEMSSTSKHSHTCDSPKISNTPKRPRTDSSVDRLKAFLAEDIERKKEMVSKMDELIKVQNENASSLRRVYRTIEKGNESVATAIKELKEESINFSSLVLQTMQEKNEIKRQQLDLDLRKFEYEKNKSGQL